MIISYEVWKWNKKILNVPIHSTSRDNLFHKFETDYVGRIGSWQNDVIRIELQIEFIWPANLEFLAENGTTCEQAAH